MLTHVLSEIFSRVLPGIFSRVLPGIFSGILPGIIILGCSTFAQAAELPSLPALAGPDSIEVSRRALRAWTQDWIDDSTLLSDELTKTCTASKLEFAGFFLPAPMAEIREHLQRVFRKGRRTESGRREPFLIPFSTPFHDIAQAITLTRSEELEARFLQSRADHINHLDRREGTQIPDPILDSVFMTDKLRVVIDTTWWITLVSKRIYDEEITKHVSQAKGFWGTVFQNVAFCQAYRVRKMRNQELIRSGQVLLNSYLILEQALLSED